LSSYIGLMRVTANVICALVLAVSAVETRLRPGNLNLDLSPSLAGTAVNCKESIDRVTLEPSHKSKQQIKTPKILPHTGILGHRLSRMTPSEFRDAVLNIIPYDVAKAVMNRYIDGHQCKYVQEIAALLDGLHTYTCQRLVLGFVILESYDKLKMLCEVTVGYMRNPLCLPCNPFAQAIWALRAGSSEPLFEVVKDFFDAESGFQARLALREIPLKLIPTFIRAAIKQPDERVHYAVGKYFASELATKKTVLNIKTIANKAPALLAAAGSQLAGVDVMKAAVDAGNYDAATVLMLNISHKYNLYHVVTANNKANKAIVAIQNATPRSHKAAFHIARVLHGVGAMTADVYKRALSFTPRAECYAVRAMLLRDAPKIVFQACLRRGVDCAHCAYYVFNGMFRDGKRYMNAAVDTLHQFEIEYRFRMAECHNIALERRNFVAAAAMREGYYNAGYVYDTEDHLHALTVDDMERIFTWYAVTDFPANFDNQWPHLLAKVGGISIRNRRQTPAGVVFLSSRRQNARGAVFQDPGCLCLRKCRAGNNRDEG
jgi:hypothetical protein